LCRWQALAFAKGIERIVHRSQRFRVLLTANPYLEGTPPLIGTCNAFDRTYAHVIRVPCGGMTMQ
jgi:hypothetical protein